MSDERAARREEDPSSRSLDLERTGQNELEVAIAIAIALKEEH